MDDNKQQDSMENTPVPAEDTAEKPEVVEAENVSEEMESLTAQIKEQMKKYKLTMWALIASIVFYLLFLFVIRQSWSTYVVFGICIVMIVLAVINTKISRKIQKLAAKRAELKKAMEKPMTTDETDNSGLVGSQDSASPIVANAKSLNDLPKQYTVLDEVDLGDGKSAEHIVVSPYGVAIIGDPDLRSDVEVILQEAGVEAPIFVYDPATPVEQLAEEIQMEKTVALDEKQVMDLLYKLTGLK